MSTPPQIPVSPKTYSPVKVPDSPLSSLQGQLTGIPRRVRDSTADLFNTIQEWNRLHINGIQIIHQIKNKKLDELEKKGEVNVYPGGLQELCDNLEEICNKLTSIVDKLKTVEKNFEAIKQLQGMKGIVRPIFVTWTNEKYVSITKTVCDAYKKEMLVKSHVQENIAHVSSKEDVMLYCALWAHQPYIDKNLNFLLESMLKETGHR